ncbi:putative receptor expression-enhancing protein [Clavispora lusitaniae]|uniref:Receptor expression-enhancing protein n=1 Tax=Clavispora lusitaniae TaxID=36911 RepID=A0ACD0WLV6_CLALS|nr:putative receptor expression-enhancing protein [Clavispora lusitaniae]QFZ34054.1 putative receptor expression-enhancing protein [Clavispora lusitaniae]QFZ39738.1 putative receptor expression-enhancing protein [Clavispora lusitaniae]QFZ45420.1 putative receptor expression-enhancing protein [Clavispora lusitaniae]QFZ51084.1 putative receptor expression-enhancing protein [Clavispora lusitaniae]
MYLISGHASGWKLVYNVSYLTKCVSIFNLLSRHSLWMQSMTLTCSWGVSVLYPTFASYKAFDNYSKLSSSLSATTVNVGGVSVSFGTLLRRANSKEDSKEEDELTSHLMRLQMWLIYWMVNGCFGAAEACLCLKYVPLYSMLRLAFSIWLISPIVLSAARLGGSGVVSKADIQNRWIDFSSSGCGLIFFRFVKPFMDEHLSKFERVGFDNVLGGAFNLISAPFSGTGLGSAKSSTDNPSNPTVISLMHTMASYPWSFLSHSGTTNINSTTENVSGPAADLDDYDVVDPPISAIEDGINELNHRNTKGNPTPRRWLW